MSRLKKVGNLSTVKLSKIDFSFHKRIMTFKIRLIQFPSLSVAPGILEIKFEHLKVTENNRIEMDLGQLGVKILTLGLGRILK